MPSPLQAKDDHWRKRPNGASPVIDPGLSPPGTDEEAGGARASPAGEDEGPRPPMSASPDTSGGVRLPLPFWFGLAGAIAVIVLVFLFLSL